MPLDVIQVRIRALRRSLSREQAQRWVPPLRARPGKTGCVYLQDPPGSSARGILLPDDVQGRLRNDHGFLVCPPSEDLWMAQVFVMPFDGLWIESRDLFPGGHFRLYGTIQPFTMSVRCALLPTVTKSGNLVYPAVHSDGVDWSKVTMLGANILIESGGVIKRDPKTGFFLPDAAANAPVEGVVKSVGPDVQSVKVGDVVLFSPKLTIVLEYDGDIRHLLAEEDAIYAIKEGDL